MERHAFFVCGYARPWDLCSPGLGGVPSDAAEKARALRDSARQCALGRATRRAVTIERFRAALGALSGDPRHGREARGSPGRFARPHPKRGRQRFTFYRDLIIIPEVR